MKKILVLNLLLAGLTIAWAQEVNLKVWRKELVFKPIEDDAVITAHIQKYGVRSANPGYAFYQTYTSTVLCAREQTTDEIKSLVYYGGAIKDNTSFTCECLDLQDKKLVLWIGELPLSGKIIVAVAETSKRDYGVEDLEAVHGSEIALSMEPLSDAAPDKKFMGDKIVAQTGIECDVPLIEKKQVMVDLEKKSANIDIRTKDGKVFELVFDLTRNELSQKEVK